MQKTWVDPWVGKIPWKRKWQPTPEVSPGESWTEEPGGLQSMGPQRVKHDLVTDTTRALSVVKMSVLSKVIFRFNTIPTIIPAGLFVKMYKMCKIYTTANEI